MYQLRYYKMQIDHKGSVPANVVTISIGVAAIYAHSSTSHEELIVEADKALYQAKEKGRNCVEVAQNY